MSPELCRVTLDNFIPPGYYKTTIYFYQSNKNRNLIRNITGNSI